jgi:PKHD-type hydroxylase
MSVFQFLPNRPYYDCYTSFVTWQNGFTNEEIDQIVNYCDTNLILEDAEVGGNNIYSVNPGIRRSKVGWIKNNVDTFWFYSRLAWITRELNSKFYNFDLYGFVEDFQYTVYNDNESGHYDWHTDASPKADLPRKLSIVLQLSSPEDYDGGELMIRQSSTEETVYKEKGLIAGFPSYVQHKVNPVTRGTRKTLVIWSAGPAFR